eukprot:1158206-Pelagomonas_calceolata.AAC.1
MSRFYIKGRQAFKFCFRARQTPRNSIRATQNVRKQHLGKTKRPDTASDKELLRAGLQVARVKVLKYMVNKPLSSHAIPELVLPFLTFFGRIADTTDTWLRMHGRNAPSFWPSPALPKFAVLCMELVAA